MVEGERKAFEHQLSCTGCMMLISYPEKKTTVFADQKRDPRKRRGAHPGPQKRLLLWTAKALASGRI